jgi:hypothetical protein
LSPLVDRQSEAGMAFECLICGTVWIRNHIGDGDFRWEKSP